MSAQYRMADRLAAGQLRDVMAAYRSAGRSYASVARELFAAHGIEVTAETVRSWCAALDIDSKPSTAGAA
jgi:hypothetical protein